MLLLRVPGATPVAGHPRCCSNGRVEIADVRFVEVDGLAIAWQQFGVGPDCLVIPPLVSNVELYWEHEFFRRWMEFHARHMRVTHFDKRGIGLSDRVDRLPSLEERIHDIVAVMDAAGLDRAHVFAMSEGGLMAQLFAARYPERVERLVLVNSVTIGYPATRDVSDKFERVIEDWGRDPHYFLEWFSPSQATNETFDRWWLRLQRQSATRTEFARQVASVVALATEPIDPDFVTSIEAPTLVVNMTRDQVIEPASGDWLAAKLPNATRVTFDSDDHFFFAGDHWFEMITLVVEFMIGAPVHAPSERKLAAVVFTDIVGSTAATAAAGDAAWGAALDEHDRIAWATSDLYSGTIVKSTGDGLLVYFDSPHAAIGFCRDLRIGLDQAGLHIRAGIHAGEIEVRANRDITGIAVNLAARIEQSAPDASIYVSSTVRDMLLGGETCFEDRGEHLLKGFDQPWKLYELTS
jgi:class 3 adenylate cyclase/pimeloyl-ACP methyl ester carboxylesterase